MKRSFDLFISIILIIILLIPMIIVAIAVRISSEGPVIYWSDRVGKDNKIFKMPKFRTMLVGTPALASHLLKNPHLKLSPIGRFLRHSSLDEMPQLFSVLKGEMSFVGPRPALYNQDELIALRNENSIYQLTPGITGWAQVNGRDELTISAKVNFDLEYLNHQSFWFDLKILFLTLLRVFNREGVSH